MQSQKLDNQGTRDSSRGNRFLYLECIGCKTRYPTRTHSRCTKCGGLLDARYDLEGLDFDLKNLRRGSIWQFRDLMPPIAEKNIVTLGEGWTALVSAGRYGESIQHGDTWCKLEGQNPTGSFKDRAASLGVSLTREWGKKGVFVSSSGNAAAAVAAYAARAGIGCLVLIREDSTASKLGQIAMYGASLLRVRGIFNSKETLERALNLTQEALPEWLNHFIWSPYNPLLVDGLKTVAYEIAAQAGAGENLPDFIFVPTAGGDLLYGIYKGFMELKEAGAIDRVPGMVVAQGRDSSPTVSAIETGAEKVPETERAETIAGALRVNFGTEHALVAVRSSKGFGVALSDEEILAAQRGVARLDGIFTEVSSATALAGIPKAIEEGKMGKDQKALAILTGFGLKDYYPPFNDISKVPLAQSIESIPEALRNTVFKQ